MAEYLSATSTRRKSIIQAARFPKTAVVTQYDYAREGLSSFLNDDTRSIRHIADTIDFLERRKAKPGASDWIKRDSAQSIEAITAFQAAYNRLGLKPLQFISPPGRLPKLDIWPTKISVSLDVISRKPTKGGGYYVGGAMLLFSKGEKSTKARSEQCRVIAGLIYTFCGTHLKGLGQADPSLCLAIDVLTGVSYKPPGTFAKKARNVADACDEISAIWPTVRPPADYDGPDPD